MQPWINLSSIELLPGLVLEPVLLSEVVRPASSLGGWPMRAMHSEGSVSEVGEVEGEVDGRFRVAGRGSR